MLGAGSELYLTVAPLLLLVVALGLGVAVVRLAQLRRSLAALARDARDMAQGKPRQRLMLDGDARVADVRLAITEMAQALGTQVAAAEAEHAQLATISPPATRGRSTSSRPRCERLCAKALRSASSSSWAIRFAWSS